MSDKKGNKKGRVKRAQLSPFLFFPLPSSFSSLLPFQLTAKPEKRERKEERVNGPRCRPFISSLLPSFFPPFLPSFFSLSFLPPSFLPSLFFFRFSEGKKGRKAEPITCQERGGEREKWNEELEGAIKLFTWSLFSHAIKEPGEKEEGKREGFQ